MTAGRGPTGGQRAARAISRPRVLADHDFNERIVHGVLRVGLQRVEFHLARDLGLAAQPDDSVLDEAARRGLIVVSHDVNTMSAAARDRLSEGSPFSGLVLISQSVPVGVAITELILIWSESDADDWRDQPYFLPLFH